VTAPQDPFSTPPQGSPGEPSGFGAPGGQPSGYGAPAGEPAGYGAPSGQPAGYGAPAYGAPAYGQQPAAGFGGHMTPRNGFGIAALVLGLLSLPAAFTVIFGVLLGIAAVIFGALGRGRAKKGQANNGGMAVAGLVLGIVGIVVSLVIAAFVGSLLSRADIDGFRDCLESAGSDQAAKDACAAEFGESVSG
jgi:hypothetical protein